MNPKSLYANFLFISFELQTLNTAYLLADYIHYRQFVVNTNRLTNTTYYLQSILYSNINLDYFNGIIPLRLLLFQIFNL